MKFNVVVVLAIGLQLVPPLVDVSQRITLPVCPLSVIVPEFTVEHSGNGPPLLKFVLPPTAGVVQVWSMVTGILDEQPCGEL